MKKRISLLIAGVMLLGAAVSAPLASAKTANFYCGSGFQYDCQFYTYNEGQGNGGRWHYH